MITAIQPIGLQNKQNGNKLGFTATLDTSKLLNQAVEESFISTQRIASKTLQKNGLYVEKFLEIFENLFEKYSENLSGNAVIKHSVTKNKKIDHDFVIKYTTKEGQVTFVPVRASDFFRFTEDGNPKVKNIVQELESGIYRKNHRK